MLGRDVAAEAIRVWGSLSVWFVQIRRISVPIRVSPQKHKAGRAPWCPHRGPSNPVPLGLARKQEIHHPHLQLLLPVPFPHPRCPLPSRIQLSSDQLLHCGEHMTSEAECRIPHGGRTTECSEGPSTQGSRDGGSSGTSGLRGGWVGEEGRS